MLLARLRCRLRHEKASRWHPTPKQAFYALSEGRCMYAAPGRSCSSKPKAVGLRDDFDGSDILVCKGHYGALRHMDPWRLDELERDLTRAFASRFPRRNGDGS